MKAEGLRLSASCQGRTRKAHPPSRGAAIGAAMKYAAQRPIGRSARLLMTLSTSKHGRRRRRRRWRQLVMALAVLVAGPCAPPPCVPAARKAFWGGFAGFAYEHHHRQQREKQACRRRRSGSSSKQWPGSSEKDTTDGSKRTRREASSKVMHARPRPRTHARFPRNAQHASRACRTATQRPPWPPGATGTSSWKKLCLLPPPSRLQPCA